MIVSYHKLLWLIMRWHPDSFDIQHTNLYAINIVIPPYVWQTFYCNIIVPWDSHNIESLLFKLCLIKSPLRALTAPDFTLQQTEGFWWITASCLFSPSCLWKVWLWAAKSGRCFVLISNTVPHWWMPLVSDWPHLATGKQIERTGGRFREEERKRKLEGEKGTEAVTGWKSDFSTVSQPRFGSTLTPPTSFLRGDNSSLISNGKITVPGETELIYDGGITAAAEDNF